MNIQGLKDGNMNIDMKHQLYIRPLIIEVLHLSVLHGGAMSVVCELKMPESDCSTSSIVSSFFSPLLQYQFATIKKMTMTRKKETVARMMVAVMITGMACFSTTVLFMLSWPLQKGTSQYSQVVPDPV